MVRFRFTRPTWPCPCLTRKDHHWLLSTKVQSPLVHAGQARLSTPTDAYNRHRCSSGTIASRSALIARHLSSSSEPPFTSQQISVSLSKDRSGANMPSPYSVRKIGQPNTFEYRVFAERDGVPLSWFHDIPLYANEQQTILNMIVEIPRWTNSKLEVGPNLSTCLTRDLQRLRLCISCPYKIQVLSDVWGRTDLQG